MLCGVVVDFVTKIDGLRYRNDNLKKKNVHTALQVVL